MTHSATLMDISPRLVFDLAARVDPLPVLADNYGLDEQYLTQVMELPHVKRLIFEKRKELDDAGFVLAAKAKLCYEDLLGDVYKKAKSENATLSGVLEAAKFFRTASGLDKQDASAQQAEKFSITINIGGEVQQPLTIDMVQNVMPTGVVEIDFEALPPTPDWVPKISALPDLMTDVTAEA